MQADAHGAARRRLAARIVFAAAGVVSLVGSGGGFPPLCFDCIDPQPGPPSVFVTPVRATRQVGQPVTFTASVLQFGGAGPVTLQWCRQAAAAACVPIPGATAPTYTLPSATLADDGVRFQAVATNALGFGQEAGRLAVTAAAAVVFADGDFVADEWTVVAVTEPAGAPMQAEASRVGTGGLPQAFRAVTTTSQPPGGTLRAFHTPRTGVYDPAVRGAMYVVDFALDCARVSWQGSAQVPAVRPMLAQGARRFVPRRNGLIDGPTYCNPLWQSLPETVAVTAGEFVQVDGPPCPAGAACPDFSVQAAPIQLGFETALEVPDLAVPAIVVQGIDNWRVTVWPR
jgi:hypothetical protein